MPYIDPALRQRFEPELTHLIEKLKGEPIGCLNYVISKIIWELFKMAKSYTKANELVGCLSCIKQEFYRRQVTPYEDTKMQENTDI